ncbi:MAG: pyridoxamine 5'-phosphate oxidase [Pseudomonadota bacterium]
MAVTDLSSDRAGIFAGQDPFDLARAWLAEAEKTEPEDPNAMALATVDADGLPNVRMVLLKGIPDDGFVFYTNYTSTKGAELEASGGAAAVLHWKSLRRQVRFRGPVTRADAQTSDSYYRSRSLESRIGAWASDQSKPLDTRGDLEAQVAAATARLGSDPARPVHWGGFVIRPVQMEFWCDGPARLHDRFRWTRNGDESWSVARLNP